MTKAKSINLNANEAVILQQIFDDGEDEIRDIEYEMHMPHHQIIDVIGRLRRKGFVTIKSDFDSMWIRVTARGRHLMLEAWPEAGYGSRLRI